MHEAHEETPAQRRAKVKENLMRQGMTEQHAEYLMRPEVAEEKRDELKYLSDREIQAMEQRQRDAYRINKCVRYSAAVK